MGNGKTRKGSKILSRIHGEDCWPTVEKISPCEEACPIHMDVPSYVIALSQGKFKEALAVIRETNPFPFICGKICHHPCEEACSRSLVDKPIAIMWLKRFVGEYQEKSGYKVKRVKRTKEERVAIIGSGPAGLTAAHDLAKQGYGVSVYEALPVAGGMLAAGIPDFVLSGRTVEIEVGYIEALGVNIKTNMRVGKDITIDDLRNQGYSAILLATGAWGDMGLSIPGTDLKGVVQALPFLRDIKLGGKSRLKGTVCIIGGGNTALDAARTAVRLGASKVILTCLESRNEMPAYEWEIEIAENEGVEIMPSLAPQQFIGRTGGKLSKINFKKVSSISRDNNGKFSWTLKDGPKAEITLDADHVIVAIGQVTDTSFINKVKLTGNGTFDVDPETLGTNIPGLFAAGDAVKVPGSVVDAIAAGHQAAMAMDNYLQGTDSRVKSAGKPEDVVEFEEEMLPPFLAKKDRWDMPSLSAKDAVRSFSETDLGYTEWQVIEEAKRCLNCRMCGNCIFGRSQICLETSNRLLAL